MKALTLFPKHASIHLKYAGFLRHVRKDIPRASAHYKEATEVNPNYADALGSYASFLHGTGVEGSDKTVTENLYQRAIEVWSQCCSTIAVAVTASAITIAVTNGRTLPLVLLLHLQLPTAFDINILCCPYYLFYFAIQQADNTHVNNFCNYGLYLSEEMGKFEKAEEMYR